MPNKDPKKNGEDKEEQGKGKKNNSQKQDAKDTNGKSNALEMNLAEGEIIHYFDWKKAFTALVIYSILAMIVLASVYLGFSWWGEKKAEQNEFFSNKSKELETRIKKLKGEMKPVFVFKRKLEIIDDKLLSKHIYWTNFFDYLEENTLEPVNYTTFSGNTNGVYSLPVIGDDYDIINSQVKLMREKDSTKMAKVRAAAKSGAEGDEEGEGSDPEASEIMDKVNSEVMFDLELEVSKKLFTE